MNLAEERYDAVAAAAQQSYEDRTLADWRVESAAWRSFGEQVDSAEAAVAGHVAHLKKMNAKPKSAKLNKLSRKLERLDKAIKLAGEWHELDIENDSDLGQ